MAEFSLRGQNVGFSPQQRVSTPAPGGALATLIGGATDIAKTIQDSKAKEQGEQAYQQTLDKLRRVYRRGEQEGEDFDTNLEAKTVLLDALASSSEEARPFIRKAFVDASSNNPVVGREAAEQNRALQNELRNEQERQNIRGSLRSALLQSELTLFMPDDDRQTLERGNNSLEEVSEIYNRALRLSKQAGMEAELMSKAGSSDARRVAASSIVTTVGENAGRVINQQTDNVLARLEDEGVDTEANPEAVSAAMVKHFSALKEQSGTLATNVITQQLREMARQQGANTEEEVNRFVNNHFDTQFVDDVQGLIDEQLSTAVNLSQQKYKTEAVKSLFDNQSEQVRQQLARTIFRLGKEGELNQERFIEAYRQITDRNTLTTGRANELLASVEAIENLDVSGIRNISDIQTLDFDQAEDTRRFVEYFSEVTKANLDNQRIAPTSSPVVKQQDKEAKAGEAVNNAGKFRQALAGMDDKLSNPNVGVDEKRRIANTLVSTINSPDFRETYANADQSGRERLREAFAESTRIYSRHALKPALTELRVAIEDIASNVRRKQDPSEGGRLGPISIGEDVSKPTRIVIGDDLSVSLETPGSFSKVRQLLPDAWKNGGGSEGDGVDLLTSRMSAVIRQSVWLATGGKPFDELDEKRKLAALREIRSAQALLSSMVPSSDFEVVFPALDEDEIDSTDEGDEEQ